MPMFPVDDRETYPPHSTGETYPLAEIGLDPFPLVDTTTVETIEYEYANSVSGYRDIVKVTTTTTVHQAPAAP